MIAKKLELISLMIAMPLRLTEKIYFVEWNVIAIEK